jgi:nucleoside-diphosphate-sugar epimerase
MIFVVGGNGFVGSAFVRACRASGREHAVITRENYADFRGQPCSVLINANGNSKKFLAAREPLADFDQSVRSVRASLVDFAYDTYVFLSSGDVYPDCSRPELTREATVIDPARQSPYGFHKLLAEMCVRHAARKHLIFRMGGFVGPGLRKNPIYDILHGGPLWLHADSELQFLHTDALAATVLELLDRGVRNETFNIGGKGVIGLREVIDAVGMPVTINQPAPQLRYEINLEKISSLVNSPESRRSVLEFVRHELAMRQSHPA